MSLNILASGLLIIRKGVLMYFRKVLDFQRPKRLICESEKPRAAAHEAAHIYCEFCTDEFQDCKMRQPAIKGMDKL